MSIGYWFNIGLIKRLVVRDSTVIVKQFFYIQKITKKGTKFWFFLINEWNLIEKYWRR